MMWPTSTLQLLGCFVVGLVSLVVWLISFKKAKNEFYSDVKWLFPLGIYVWGDALILAPFWLISAVIWMGVTPLFIFRYFLLFGALRSCYEVIYWINHQVVAKNYIPPLFRRWGWLAPNESAILYQLLHTCLVILYLFLLMLTWTVG